MLFPEKNLLLSIDAFLFPHLAHNLNGRLQKLEFSGTTAYVQLTYDAAGRLWALKDTRLPVADLGGDTFYYEYDDNNRPTIITYPDGETIVYTYDAAGRRTSMTAPLPPSAPPRLCGRSFKPS